MNWEILKKRKIKTENKSLDRRALDLKLKFFIKKKFEKKDNKSIIKNNKYGTWIIK